MDLILFAAPVLSLFATPWGIWKRQHERGRRVDLDAPPWSEDYPRWTIGYGKGQGYRLRQVHLTRLGYPSIASESRLQDPHFTSSPPRNGLQVK